MSKLFNKVEFGYDMEKSEAKKSFTVKIEKQVTYQDIEDIMVTAIEGGIGYWACLNNNTPEWNEQPKDMPVSQYATELLLTGKSIIFTDAEEPEEAEKWELNLEKLLKGIGQNAKERPEDSDLDSMDADTADCIVQYALFDEIVYG